MSRLVPFAALLMGVGFTVFAIAAIQFDERVAPAWGQMVLSWAYSAHRPRA